MPSKPHQGVPGVNFNFANEKIGTKACNHEVGMQLPAQLGKLTFTE